MKPVSDGIPRTTSLKGQRGAVAVEMAIVLPLFAILLLGAFEFGDIARTHQVLQNAAREGARLGNQPLVAARRARAAQEQRGARDRRAADMRFRQGLPPQFGPAAIVRLFQAT